MITTKLSNHETSPYNHTTKQSSNSSNGTIHNHKLIRQIMKIEFKNSYRSTRNGFAHDTKMYIDGILEMENSAHYLNRTWESYTFQSVMKQAVYLRIEQEINKLVHEYKEANNKQRISKDVKESLTNELIETLKNHKL